MGLQINREHDYAVLLLRIQCHEQSWIRVSRRILFEIPSWPARLHRLNCVMNDTADRKLASLDYRVVKALGAGAGSSILLIQDSETRKQYALKVVKRVSADDDIYVKQAQHEFAVAQRLSHPSIIKIYDARVIKRWFRIDSVEVLMEYIDGKDLDHVQLKDIGQIVLIFSQIALALEHMHKRGVYHGDVKPSNLMLSHKGEVKLIDLGTAWIKGEPKNRIQGTVQYMAPEQVNERTVDERTDIYNFGATLYRILTGQYANLDIPGMNLGSLGRRMRKSPIEIRSEIPGTLNEAIMACLEEKPDQRPASFYAIKSQLLAVARHMGLDTEDIQGSGDSAEF